MPQTEKLALTSISNLSQITDELYCLNSLLGISGDQSTPNLYFQFWFHDPEERPWVGIKYATNDTKSTSRTAKQMQKKDQDFSGRSIIPINKDWFPSHGVLKVYAHVLDLEGFAQEIEVGTLTKKDQNIIFEEPQTEEQT